MEMSNEDICSALIEEEPAFSLKYEDDKWTIKGLDSYNGVSGFFSVHKIDPTGESRFYYYAFSFFSDIGALFGSFIGEQQGLELTRNFELQTFKDLKTTINDTKCIYNVRIIKTEDINEAIKLYKQFFGEDKLPRGYFDSIFVTDGLNKKD